MPPALRRSVSSPTVRAAPYSLLTSSSVLTHSSSSNSTSSAATSVGNAHHGRPRRGASDAGRRVLADIEWWRVMQGQREEDRENADENTADADADTDAGREQDTAARPRTPEPTSPLYTVSEDADQPSSAESTPPRESPLPLAFLPGAGPEFGLGLLGLGRPSADANARPRAHAAPRAFSFPGLALTAFRIADGDPITHDPDMRRR